MGSVIGHADRASPLRDYLLGLLMPGERKSVEPMAAITSPGKVTAQHQSLLHFVGQAPWSDERVLAKVRDLVVPTMERSGPIEALIIDDTGVPKKGTGLRRMRSIFRSPAAQLLHGPHLISRQPSMGSTASALT